MKKLITGLVAAALTIGAISPAISATIGRTNKLVVEGTTCQAVVQEYHNNTFYKEFTKYSFKSCKDALVEIQNKFNDNPDKTYKHSVGYSYTSFNGQYHTYQWVEDGILAAQHIYLTTH